MSRPYVDPWQRWPEPESITLDEVQARVRTDPVCEERDGARFCTRLAVTALRTPTGAIRSRCPDHAADDTPRVCVQCRQPNTGTDRYHCARCASMGRWRR